MTTYRNKSDHQMNTNAIDVSIIIVNYNTKCLTATCIDSIVKYTTGVFYEIILIDNASTDGSKELFEKDDRIKFIYNPINAGFGQANNLGFQQATGNYIFLLNSDTVLKNNVVRIFYDSMRQLPRDIALIGTILKDEHLHSIHSYGIFPSLSTTIKDFLNVYLKRINIRFWDKKETYDFPFYKEVDYIIGADLFIRRDVIDEFGLFDPDFFMYYEETELQKRYRKNGYKSALIKEPIIIHLEGGSYEHKNGRISFSQFYRSTESQFIYMNKEYSSYKYILFRCIFFILRILPVLFMKEYTWKDRIKYINLLIRFS